MDISVIIPIYNVEEYLKTSLDSVARNVRNIDAEVLLIDDGSTDESGSIARAYAEKNEKFSYYHQENGGISVARNRGAAMAKGDYIIFPDSDDVVCDGIFEKMLAAARRNGTDLTICDVARIRGTQVTDSGLHRYAFHGLKENLTHITKHPQLVYDSITWNKLIKRSFYEENGFSFPVGKRYEDMPVITLMHYLANGVSVVYETGFLWRIRTGKNLSITQLRDDKSLYDKIEMMEQLMQIAESRIKEPEVRLAIEKKHARIDFNAFVETLDKFDEETAKERVEAMARFAEKYISEEALSQSPVFIRQMFRYILDRDAEKACHLMRYRAAAYNGLPVLPSFDEEGAVEAAGAGSAAGGLHLKVREEFFTIPGRSIENEDCFNLRPSCWIDKASYEDGVLSLDGHIYIRRISVTDPKEQKVSAYLMDQVSGRRLALNARSAPDERLTREAGQVLNLDDYEKYRYNYDGTGFRIDVDFAKAAEEFGEGARCVIFIECENKVFRGDRVLGGMAYDARQTITAAKHLGRSVAVSTEIDKGNYLILSIEPYEKEKVSVIVPVYNCGKHLGRCLESLRSQTYRNIEVLMIDDGSTDGSGQICDRFAEEDGRFIAVHTENGGVSHARNLALEKMTGSRFMFADADDLVSANYVERLCEVMDSECADIVTCVAKDTADPNIKSIPVPKKKKPVVKTIDDYDFTKRWSHRVVWGAVYRREVLGDIRFREKFDVSEDTLFFAELLKKVRRTVHLNEELYCYIYYPESVAHGRFNRKRFSEVLVWEEIAQMMADEPDLPRFSSGASVVTRCLDHMKKLAKQGEKDGELYKELAAHARGRGAEVAGSTLSANKKKRLKWFCRFPEKYVDLYLRLGRR